MAKDSKKKLTDRIKKSTPNNQWFINVGKSLGFTTMDVIQELLPNTFEFIDWNKDSAADAMDMLTQIRDNRSVRPIFNKQFDNIPQIKAAGNIYKNALADIKSGKLYNKDRGMGFGDDGEFDFDSFGGDLQFIDDDEPSDSDSGGGESSRPPVTVINTMPLAKTMAASTELTVSTMTAIAEQQMAVESEKILFDQRAHNTLLNAVSSMNQNLALLVSFNSESTAKYQAAAMKFYEESLELMKPKENDVGEKVKSKVKEMLNPFTSGGTLKLDEYMKVVKRNIVNIKDENASIGTIFDFLADADNLNSIAENPLGMILPMLAQGVVPKKIKDSLKKLDKNMNAILPALLARVNSFEGDDSPFLDALGKVFGYKEKADYNIKLGDYEKGRIPWDGESKKALVEVIPTYLRRIESALTGTEERIFDYSTGKFTGIKQIKDDYEQRINQAQTSGYSSAKIKMDEIVRAMNLSKEAQDQYKKDRDELFLKMNELGYAPSHVTRKDKDGMDIDEFTQLGLFDGDYDRIEFMKKVLNGMPIADLIEMGTMGIADSIEKSRKQVEEIRQNPNLFGYSVLHNNSVEFDANGKVKYSGKQPGMTDRYGLNQLDYLRDIRTALINGIKVFPDMRQKYRNPNLTLQRKMTAEEDEYQAKLREEEKKRKEQAARRGNGQTMFEAVVNNEDQWKRAYKQANDIEDDEESAERKNFIDTLNERVEGELFEIMYGNPKYRERTINTLNKTYTTGKSVADKVNSFLKDDVTGFFTDSFKGFFGDVMGSFKSFFTGLGYTTSDGTYVEGHNDGFFSKIKNFFTGNFEKVFKGKDGEDSLIKKFTTDFMAGYEKFKVSLFGEKAASENQAKETFQDLMGKVKQRLPRALGYGLGGAMLKTAFASQLGVLGSFLMPGGPLAAVLAGTTFGFLKQSETFNKFMFGEKDENGERVGGFISKAWQDKYKENKSSIVKGAGIGLLGSLFLPGGPVLGVLTGIGASIYARNESFQEFLYGKDYKTQDKKSIMNGAFGRAFKNLLGKEEGDRDPQLAKFLGAGGLGIGIAQGVGLLPSFLLPGGPIMGAMLGLAGGIAASSEKFQQFLLGEKDIDGKRYGGLLTQVTNWFNTSFMQPLRIKATEMTDKIYGFMRKKLFDPIARSFEPILYAVKNVAIDIKNGIVDAFTHVTSPIVEAFKDYVIKPIGKILKKTILDPIKWIMKKTFGLVTKGILGVLTAPLQLISGIGHAADRYNAGAEVRHEQRNRRKEYDKTHSKEDGTWNYYERKKAGKMTKEEKKELIDEKLKYRDGKTWRQRKKEQKGEYKDEMQRRKERRQQMKDQYEEDKKFMKEHGYKYASKKQKERREQELKEKQAWYQEQQLMKAQDTDEKVSKITDNVIQFPEQNKKVVDKLDELKNTLQDGFDKLTGKYNDYGKYGEVTDEHLKPIYNYLDGKPIHDGMHDSSDITIDPAKLHDPDLQERVAKLNKKFKQRKSNVIDINKYLQDNDQSHEDGLDKVPTDGYIAELHKDEMVVPEKPAGKLRQMMDNSGKGFEGLTDALTEDIKNDDEQKSLLSRAISGLSNGLNSFTGMMGNIAGLFGGLGIMSEAERDDREDNAMQLTDMEADRLKELEDKARYEHASRKDADFVRGQIEAKNKEKEERQWKENLLNAVKHVGSATAAAASNGLNLFELIGDGLGMIKDGLGNIFSGLGSLALPAAIAAGVYGWNQYKQTEEYKESRTDVDNDGDGEGDFIYDNTDANIVRGYISAREKLIFKPIRTIKKKVVDPIVTGGKNLYKGGKKAVGGVKKVSSKIYNSKVGQKVLQPIGNKINKGKEFIFGSKSTTGAADNVVDFSQKKLTKEAAEAGSGKAVNKAIKGSTDNVVDFSQKRLAKEAAEGGSGKAVKKVIGETVEGATDNAGFFKKMIEMAKTAIQAIGDKLSERFPGLAKKMAGLSDELLEVVIRNSDGIIKKFAKKIATWIGRVAAGTSTGFVLDAVFGVCDLVSGATAGNAGNLFGVSPENVNIRMRVISSVLQVVTNFNVLGVIGLINEITSAMFNLNFIRMLAIGIYNLISPEEDELHSRITASQIDNCTSIEEALNIMGITDPKDIAMLKNGNEWKNFTEVKNDELGGVITETEQMELARLQYNLENGTKLSSQAYIDKESKTLGSKIIDGTMKLFKSETAQQKINKLETKAQKDRDKAAEHRKKAEESTNIFSKGYNKYMAWANEKQAERKEKKIEKKKVKAEKKKTKAEEKAAYHEEKAANSSGLSKKYHEWRAKKNKKKVEKYTIENGKVEPEETGTDTGTEEITAEEQYGLTPQIMTPEQFRKQYPDAEPGQTYYDGFGNAYDSEGNYLGDAGMGDGELENQVMMPQQYQESEKKKGSGILSKTMKAFLSATPGGAALSTLFGKNKKAKDYRMVPIMDENGNIVSYQSKLIDDTTEIEGFDKTNVKVDKMGKNVEVIPQTDEKGNVLSYTTVEKGKSKGLFGSIASGIGSIFGLGSTSTSNSSSVDNSVTTTTSGDTYTTNNTTEVDTTMFGPLADAINKLVGVNTETGEGNPEASKILTIIMDPMGYFANKLTNIGINIYESKTGKEVDQEKLNKGIEIFNMLRNPIGYLYNKTKDYLNNEENQGKSLKEIGKNAIEDGKENIKKSYETAKDWTVDKYNKAKDWGKEKVKNVKDWGTEKYNQVKDWGKKQYNKSDDVADIMMGDNSAKANVLSTIISGTGDIGTAIWNKFAPEDAQLAEGEMADFFATMINKMIVTPFKKIMDPLSEKFNEAKEAVSGWINEKKEAVVGWFNEKIKEPFSKFMDKAKDKITEMKDAAASWINEKKEVIFGWFNEKVKEPFTNWMNKAKDKINEAKEAAASWINEKKEVIFGWFNEKVKEPFSNWMNKMSNKISEAKEAAANWINDKKDKIFNWYNEKVKEPFSNFMDKAKDKIAEAKEAAGNWISDKKDKIFDWFNEKVKEPFSNWMNKAKDKIEDIKEGAKNWIGGMKDKIVETFNKYIKEPIGDALKPVSDAVSGAWSSLKSAFEPIAEIFNAIKEGRWGDIAKIVKDVGSEGRENANADEDNLRSGPKPSEYQTTKNFKPVQHNISSSELLKPMNTTNNNTTTTNKTNNKFVFYNQSDARWGNEKIGDRHMKDAGCGPTSLAMAVSQLTGEQITPDTIAKLGQEHLPGYAQYSLFPSIAGKLNMNYTEGKDQNFIMRNLKQGIPVILSGRTSASGNPYTSEGHVVTASHMKGNMVYIQDPRGEQYSRYYPINSLMHGLTKGMILTPSSTTDVSALSSGLQPGLEVDPVFGKQGLGLYGDSGEYLELNDFDENLGRAGAGQITVADKVLSYARAFLANTSKFKYSQPKRDYINQNKNYADCSSFVSHVLTVAGDAGKVSGTSSTFWSSIGSKVSDPQIGDVVCQEGHVGLYSGSGNYIHMSGRKAGIKESKAIQNGNNPHRGYKRVLKNPSAMVDPTITGGNSLLGTVVGSSSGNPVGGGSGGGGPQASLDKALLIGDSLTVGMEKTLEGKYPNANAMGKGGKWAKHWLSDLGSLPAADKVGTVIQWLGINGVHDNKNNMKDSQTLLTKLKEKYPNVPIFNMRIFPTTQKYSYGNYTGEWWRKLSQEFNDGMSSWASSNGVTQIDATNGFIQSDGYLDPSKAVDGIHFTTDGYKGVLANIETAIGNYNSSNTGSSGGTAAAPAVDPLGIFGKLQGIGTGLVASIYNGRDVFDEIMNPSTGTTDPNTGGTTTPGDGSNPDIGGISDNATAIWKFFTGKGYSGQATAGIMGNLQQESGLDPTIKQHGGGPGRGIAQWTVSEERFKGLEAHAKSKGKDWTDLQSQVEWIDMELNGKDPSTKSILDKRFGGIEGFKKATDTNWAVEAFEKSFERAGKPNYTNRYKYAKDFYAKFSNAGMGPAMATTAQAAPTDGSIPDSMNGWKFYQQSDPKWKGDVGGSSVSAGGCGPTSAAMMLSTIFGKQINPLTMTKWAHSNGTWTGAMQWTMPGKVASEFGLSMTDLGSNANGVDSGVLTKVKDSIKAGKPVILTGRGTGASGSNARTDTPFTPGGHVVLAVGVDSSGNIIINDPRGAGRTKAYTDEGILNVGVGLRGAWAFDTSGGSIPSDIQTDGDYTGGGSYTGDSGTSTGGSVAAAPAVDPLGIFGKLSGIGTGLIASIYNGKDVFDAIMNPSAGTTDTSTGTTGGGGTGGEASWNGTQYDTSSYNYSDLSSEKQEHIKAILQPALHTFKTHNLFPSVTIGQSAHESYWGPKSGLATKGKNLFGIKCGSKWTGKAYTAKTGEFLDGKNVTITDSFRAYDSYADSVIDRASFLSADRYKRVLAATSPDAQIEALKACGYATDPSYVTKLKDIVHDNKLTRFDTPKPPKELSGNAGMGDGKTYMVQPKGHAGMGDGKVSYTKSVNTGVNTTDVNAQRNLEAINRKINVAVNNINASDPNAYAEILKLIMQELQAINDNTAATASGVHNIEIVSANAPINDDSQTTSADLYRAGKKQKPISKLQTINSSTGYSTARQIAGYKK